MSKKNGKNVVITINGINDAELIGAIKYLVATGNGTMTISEGSDQTTKATTSKAKAKTPKGVTIAKVDRYGNQWIWNGKYDAKGNMCTMYDPVVYAKAKADAIAKGTYNSKNRSAIYKALGWIL